MTDAFTSKWSTPVLLVAILLAVGSFLWWLNIPFIEDIGTMFFITLTMVMGFQLFMGNSGILNWSYVGFVGIGAFASAICSMSPQLKAAGIPEMYDFLVQLQLPFPLALVAGALVAGVVAAAVGWPLMRLSDTVGIITQFALLIVINVVLLQWQQVTNGPRTFTLGGTRLTGIWLAMGVSAVALVLAFWFKESAMGLRLRATRDDHHAASSIGISMVTARYWPYIISATIGGLAGGLLSHYLLSLTARSFYLAELFLVLTMLIVGGSLSVTGGFFGAVIVTVTRQVLRQVEGGLTQSGVEASGMTEIVLAFLMILFLAWRPRGVSGGWELSLDSILRPFRKQARSSA